MKTLVIVPTYNEKENIQELANSLFRTLPDTHLLVVDDSSPDGTGALVEGLRAKNPKIFLLTRAKKEGIAKAYISGFHWALEKDYDLVVTMDGDMSHHPCYIPKMLEQAQDHAMVVGSRWVRGGGIRNWPWYRKMISLGGTMYARIVLGLPVTDLTGGFNCYQRELLEKVGPQNIHADGYGFQIEMKWRALRAGFSFKEIPIVFPDRRKGKSKFSRKIFAEAIFLVWRLRFAKV